MDEILKVSLQSAIDIQTIHEPYRFSTTSTYLMITGMSVTNIVNLMTDQEVDIYMSAPIFSCALLGITAFAGAIKTLFNNEGTWIDTVHRKLEHTQQYVALIPIVIYIWFNYEYSVTHAGFHTALLGWPLWDYWKNKKFNEDILSKITKINALSLSVISFIHTNVYGMSAAVVYLLNHHYLGIIQQSTQYPIEDLYNYGMFIHLYLVKRAIIHTMRPIQIMLKDVVKEKLEELKTIATRLQ